MSALIKPRFIRLEASTLCQLRCPSCPTTEGLVQKVAGSGYLKFADFKQLVDDNPHLEGIELSNYGEIFLNPELLDILRYGHERKIRLSCSNGANFNHVDEDVLEGLVRYQFAHITCSIDGASQQSYVKYRVRGDFDRVIKNIRRLNEHKKEYDSDLPALSWQFVVFGHNEHDILKAKELAAELGMAFNAKKTWDEQFSPIQNRELVRESTQWDSLSRDEHYEKTGNDYMRDICYQLWERPQINWDGKNVGCCRNFWGDFGGNAFEQGLTATLNNEKMNYARDMLQGKVLARDDIPCTTCDLYTKLKDSKRWLTRAEESTPGPTDSSSVLRNPRLLQKALGPLQKALRLISKHIGV